MSDQKDSTEHTRHLDYDEVRDCGVILEVNRLLLHPRGLALEVHVPGPGHGDAMFLLPVSGAFARMLLPDRQDRLGFIVEPL